MSGMLDLSRDEKGNLSADLSTAASAKVEASAVAAAATRLLLVVRAAMADRAWPSSDSAARRRASSCRTDKTAR